MISDDKESKIIDNKNTIWFGNIFDDTESNVIVNKNAIRYGTLQLIKVDKPSVSRDLEKCGLEL